MKETKRAFTLLELLVVIGTLAVLAAMLLPALASAKASSAKLTCLYNLKQVGLALRVWEGNHSGKYPMQVGKSSGGAFEYLGHNSAGAVAPIPAGYTLIPGMAFMVMSNELATPKVLYCPSDNIHTVNSGYATNFTYPDLLDLATPPGGNNVAGPQKGESPIAAPIECSKISYFINGDTTEANPQDLLTGDDNIGNNGATSASAIAKYRFGATITSPNCAVATASGAAATCVNLLPGAFNGSPWWSWTANDFHRKSGNLAFTDGSCQSASISDLHFYLNNSTNGGSEVINFTP